MNRKPLTVMQLVPSLESGGVERGTLEVADELVRRGHRSIVVSAGGRLVEKLLYGGSEHITSRIDRKSPLSLARVPKLRNLICQHNVDILHARSRIPAWIGWLAWRSLPESRRPRFVTTVHGMYSVNRFSRIMTCGERVVAVSETIRNYISENYPDVPPESICLIPRGISPQEFPYDYSPTDDWRANWSAEHPELGRKRILTLAGRITRLKGHFDFLDLIAGLKSHGVPIHGLIVGDEDPRRRQYADAVRQSVRQLELTDDITFLGHRNDIREIYAISSAILSLSTKPESFGRTTLEPLAMGVPVIGYDHGGVGEILRSVFPQGAVPLRNGRALLDKASDLIQSDRGRVPEFTHFRLRDTLDQTITLYEELTGKRTATSLSKAA